MSRYRSVRALVINKKVVRESDLLITLLTADNSKIKALAKGARNIKSNRLGTLQLGNIIDAYLYEKNGQWWLSETRMLSSFLRVNKNLAQLNLLFYFLEVINNLVAENQQIEGAFYICCQAVEDISIQQVAGFINMEIAFLEILGFGVPAEIKQSLDLADYRMTQKLIKGFIETIIEKPIESNKLFK